VKQQTINRSINRLQDNGLDGVMASRLVLLYAIDICYFSGEQWEERLTLVLLFH